jgi:hypothetical protein
MDIQRILAQLHAERQQVNEVIQILERLAQGIKRRQDFPTALSLQGLAGGKRKRTVSPEARAKLTQEPKKPAVKGKAAGN